MAATDTRTRIIRAVRRLAEKRTELPIDEIALRARVSVQTIYSHFGSKRGLLMAAIDDMQREVGLYEGFERVFSSPDGETALRRMVNLTFDLWERGWPLVRFSLAARRIDQEVDLQLTEVDSMRRTHLWIICHRLEAESRLLAGVSPERAADLAFTLSTPTVYEDLVLRRGWPAEQAASTQIELIVSAAVDPLTPPVTDPPPDWAAFGMGGRPAGPS